MAKPTSDNTRAGRMRAAAAILPRVTAKALGKHGFAVAGIVSDWPQIVGESLAAETVPLRIAFPPGERRGGTLHLRVPGPMATELQHLEPQIVERINGYFGYGAVARLGLRHGPPPRRERAPPPAATQPPAGEPDPNLAAQIGAIEDAALRQALERFRRTLHGARGADTKS
jgi:hypothetical protein